MGKLVRDVMTKDPIAFPASAPLTEAAKKMRDADIGAVIIEDNGQVCGIVTDRDITVRGVAMGKDPSTTKLGDVCSQDLTTVASNEDLDRVVDLMRNKAIRRIPVVENGHAVGILSLGDLAVERDKRSALGEISAAPPNR